MPIGLPIPQFLPFALQPHKDGQTRLLKEQSGPMSNALKLLAMDAEDLKVLSAHVQDSVLKCAEIQFEASIQQLILPLNRFAWELPSSRRFWFKKHERRRSVLHFSRVQKVQSKNINRTKSDEVLSLLAISFSDNSDQGDPSGTVELNFSGGAALSLTVECLEAQLTDLNAAWATSNRPHHHT